MINKIGEILRILNQNFHELGYSHWKISQLFFKDDDLLRKIETVKMTYLTSGSFSRNDCRQVNHAYIYEKSFLKDWLMMICSLHLMNCLFSGMFSIIFSEKSEVVNQRHEFSQQLRTSNRAERPILPNANILSPSIYFDMR